MKSIQPFIMLGAAILFAACSGSELSDLESFVKQVKSREEPNIEPLPEIKSLEPFVLDASTLRNPFIPTEAIGIGESVEIAVQNGIRPDTLRPHEELESYSLDSLRMVGTVAMASNRWGLVQAKDGTIHRVQSGNYMGQNHGKVVGILANQIELLEIIPDGPGSWRERQTSVKLSE